MRDTLAPADRARLERAAGRPVDPARSLFPPGSASWRVNREAATLLGGGCALLLQVAHPLVAAAVARHSRFESAPLARLSRTLELTLAIAFAPAAEALAAVRTIEEVHTRVHGTLDASVGPFPAGTHYDANDPALLFWVHATLVDTALRTHAALVGPLDPATRAAYYAESIVVARLFGIPEALIPPDLDAFERWMAETIAGPTLAVGVDGRRVAAAILRPPVWPGVQHAFRATNLLTVGFLPPPLRERFGLAWGPGRAAVFAAVTALSRQTVPRLPDLVRVLPQARAAR